MNVAILGNNKLSIEVTKIVLADDDVAPLIVLNHNDQGFDEEPNSLKRFVREQNLFAIQPGSINNRSAVTSLSRHRPDLLISCSYNRILKEPAIAAAGQRCINFHFSLLPKYRGCLPIIYALANGDNPIGVTIHHISPGIDSGDIIDQVPVSLDDFSTNEEAYYRCVDSAVALFQKWWSRLKHWEDIPHHVQDLEKGSYNSFVFPNDRWIDWRLDARRVVNFINALTNGSYPGARARCGDREVELLGKATVSWAGGEPGEVLEMDPEQIIIACGNNAIRVSHTRDVTDHVSLKPGDFLTGK